MKKRLLASLIVSLLVGAMCFNSSAATAQYTYEFENVTVVFDSDISLDAKGRNMVAEHLVYGTENYTTYGLWCSLFGHTYETHSASKITHCVYDTDPRCLEEIYEVQVCSRCEHTISKLLASIYISSCPEE